MGILCRMQDSDFSSLHLLILLKHDKPSQDKLHKGENVGFLSKIILRKQRHLLISPNIDINIKDSKQQPKICFLYHTMIHQTQMFPPKVQYQVCYFLYCIASYTSLISIILLIINHSIDHFADDPNLINFNSSIKVWNKQPVAIALNRLIKIFKILPKLSNWPIVLAASYESQCQQN